MPKRLLNSLPILVALFVPVFFLPITSEFFEFNKLFLIVAATILMALSWAVKMIKDGKVEVTKSPLDLPILAFGITILLATIFSLNKNISIFGANGRWFPSLFAFFVLAAFYYITTATMQGGKIISTTVNAALAGMSISSLVALIGYFGLKFGQAPYFQISNFTLTGSTTTAGLLAALACVLCVNKILSEKSDSTKMGFVALFTLNIVVVMLLGSLAAYAALVIGLLVTAYLTNTPEIVKNKVHLSAAFLVTILTVFALIIPASRNLIVNSEYPAEIKIDPRESWIVASSILRDFPILGTGPSTFALNYTRYKPLSVNNEAYWNIRFDKPYSEFFGVIGGLGIIGIITTLALVIKVSKFALDSKKYTNKEMATPLAAIVLSIFGAFLLTYATVATAFMLVLFLALLVVVARDENSSGVELSQLKLASLTEAAGMSLANVRKEKEVFQYVVALPLAALALAGVYYSYKVYAGEYYMRKAVAAAQSGDGRLTYQMQQKAITSNPHRDNYQNSFATTNLALAQSLSSKQNLTDEEKQTVQTLVAQSIRSTRTATEILNPLSAANWETRASIYRTLVGAAQDADSWAVRAYTTAIQLDPTNPRLRLSLGGVYYATGDYLSAANLFTQATNLKGDYANAHYNLAQALKQLQKYDQAQQELQSVQKLVAADSEDFKKVVAELAEISTLVNVAGASTEAKPTVSDLEGNAGTTDQNAQQEPLTNAGTDPTTPATTDPATTQQ